MSHNGSTRFDPATDPTVAKLKRQINRSAGQHKRAISEGTRSAQELNRIFPMTTDPLKLDDGIPVLRMVHSRHERPVVEPVPFTQTMPQDQTWKQLQAQQHERGQHLVRAWQLRQAETKAEAETPANEPSGSGFALVIVVTIIAAVAAWSVVASTGGADDALRVLSAAFR